MACMVAPRGMGAARAGPYQGRGGALGSGSGASERLRRGGAVGSVSAGSGCAVWRGSGNATVCGTGPHRGARLESEEALAVPGGRRVVAPGTGGGGGGSPPPPTDRPRRGAATAAVGGTGRVTVPGGAGPGGPLRHGRGGRGDRVPGTGGWPLGEGGVWVWSARVLPSHAPVLLVHGGLWPGGIGWWAVVVVGGVLVVVVAGALVVVVVVVVGTVVRP